MTREYTDEDMRLELTRLKEVVDEAVRNAGRGPRRALLAALQDSVARSVGVSERIVGSRP